MIGLVVISLAIGGAASIAVYSLMHRQSVKKRVVAAAAIFIVLAFFPIAYVIAIGDQMPEDARLVTKEELERAAQSKP